MPLENYSDLSQSGSGSGAGFQFQFHCTHCDRKWKSPFKPYRMGQISGLLTRFSYLLSSARTAGRATENFADMGSRGAKESALAEAMEHAETLYTQCPECRKAVCANCFDPRTRQCLSCKARENEDSRRAEENETENARQSSASACPNCRTPASGGRFCAECGYDMASTHKSCPGCGTMALRASRFCTDCGHSF